MADDLPSPATGVVRGNRDVERANDVLRAIGASSVDLAAPHDLAWRLNAVLARLSAAAAADHAGILRFTADGDGSGRGCEVRAYWTGPRVPDSAHDSARWSAACVNWIHRAPRVLPGAPGERHLPRHEAVEDAGGATLWRVPLVTDGSLWGVMVFEFCEGGREWLPEMAEALRGAAAAIGATIERDMGGRQRAAMDEAVGRGSEDQGALLPGVHRELAHRACLLETATRSANLLLARPQDPGATLDVLRLIGGVLAARHAAVYRLHPTVDETRLEVLHGWSAKARVPGPGLCLPTDTGGFARLLASLRQGRCWHSGQPPRAEDEPPVADVAVGIDREGVLWGALAICAAGRALADAEIHLLRLAADSFAAALCRDWAVSELVRETAARQTAVLNERGRIAREIHDSLAQSFAVATLQLEAAEAALRATEPDARRFLKNARGLLREGLDQARRCILMLDPGGLGEGDLGRALTELAERVDRHTGMRVICKVSGAEHCRTLAVDTARHLFRIAQEALHNAIRHSGGGAVLVELEAVGGALRLEVHDDGRGCDLSGIPDSFGVRHMRESALSAEAVLVFRTGRLGGLSVLIERTVGETILPSRRAGPRQDNRREEAASLEDRSTRSHPRR